LFLDLCSYDRKVLDKAHAALTKLGKSDPQFVKQLISKVKDRKAPSNQRIECAIVLRKIGDNSRPAIPALARIFLDEKEDEGLRGVCASSLVFIGHESADVFRKAIQKNTKYVMRHAADCLGRMAVNDPKLIPDLIRAFDHADDDVRTIAFDAVLE